MALRDNKIITKTNIKGTSQQSSYRQIMKATSIFGGVQVFQIIIRIIRSKFIAVLLGPAGMGIAGLLNSTIGLVGELTNFGLQTSAVKDVAAAYATNNEKRIATIVKVLRRLVWSTGIFGTIVTIVLSSWLSKITFGNTDYTLAFVWISITLFFNQITSGQLVILQGLRKIQYLARANLSGSFLGLFITVPLYYYYEIDAIVPGIIITALIRLVLSWYFSRKVDIVHVKVSKGRTIAESKNMLNMGFMISLSGVITLGVAFIVRIFISNKGSVSEVGLYNAGFAIINTYVGLIFTAMGTDYYPRLSAVAHSNKLCKKTINQQAEIALLILGPVLIIFLVFIKWIVIILYSAKFITIDNMIHWAALGMLFKAASWSMSFILLAKGASKLFFLNELLTNTYMLGLNLVGYYYWGLTGLGISFMIGYLLYFFQYFILIKIKYSFDFDKPFRKIFVTQFLLVLSCFIFIKVIDNTYAYIFGVVLFISSCLFSYKELEKRIGINNLLVNIKNKLFRKY